MKQSFGLQEDTSQDKSMDALLEIDGTSAVMWYVGKVVLDSLSILFTHLLSFKLIQRYAFKII